MGGEQLEKVPVRSRKGRPRSAAPAVKTTLNLSEDAVETMHELATARNTTFAEVVRRALALDRYIQEAARDGRRILIEDPDKTLTQLVFF